MDWIDLKLAKGKKCMQLKEYYGKSKAIESLENGSFAQKKKKKELWFHQQSMYA